MLFGFFREEGANVSGGERRHALADLGEGDMALDEQADELEAQEVVFRIGDVLAPRAGAGEQSFRDVIAHGAHGNTCGGGELVNGEWLVRSGRGHNRSI